MSTPMIIDTDTASDDAVALAMALRHPNFEVVAITSVAGNCNLDQATNNALYTVELCQSQVPVFRGADRPLLEKPRYATWFHGEDGLGDQGYPPPQRKPEALDGPRALIDAIRANPGVVLVTLGPLTNVAIALRQAPDIAGLVSRCVVMGGTVNAVGNVTPAAEFNLWFDPHAAAAVFCSDLPLELAAWELCRGVAGLNEEEQQALKSQGPLGRFFVECNETAIAAIKKQSGSTTLELPDPVAMAIALDKETVVTDSTHDYVAIESQGSLTKGMSVVDTLGVTGNPPNCQVVRRIDISRFKEMVFAAAA